MCCEAGEALCTVHTGDISPSQGDLGAIDDKYDIAISTACGPLDYIVVDNMDTAMKAVDYLKRNNLGVGTFIGLDKVGVVMRWVG